MAFHQEKFLQSRLLRDIGELKTTVNAFAESLDYANLEKCVSHIRDRDRACITKNGGQFEGGLNSLRMNWDGDKWNVLWNVHT